MRVKELKDFILKNHSRQIGFTKENSYYSMKYKKKLLLHANK